MIKEKTIYIVDGYIIDGLKENILVSGIINKYQYAVIIAGRVKDNGTKKEIDVGIKKITDIIKGGGKNKKYPIVNLTGNEFDKLAIKK